SPMGKTKPKIPKNKRSTAAPGPFLGFSVQSTRFLVRLLEARPGETVCLEVFADVGVEKADGTKFAEESKSNLTTNPLSDHSVALWTKSPGVGPAPCDSRPNPHRPGDRQVLGRPEAQTQ